MKPLVYIASPLSGDVEQNLEFARKACRFAIEQEVTPFAPHLLYTQMLDDNSPATASSASTWATRCWNCATSCGSAATASAKAWRMKKNWQSSSASLSIKSMQRIFWKSTSQLRKGWGCPWGKIFDFRQPV